MKHIIITLTAIVLWCCAVTDQVQAQDRGGWPLGWTPKFAQQYVLPCDSEVGICLDVEAMRKRSIVVVDETFAPQVSTYLFCWDNPVWKANEYDIINWFNGSYLQRTPLTEADIEACEHVNPTNP